MDTTGIMGHPIERLDIVRYTGTVSAVADHELLKKPDSISGGMPIAVQLEGRGVYIPDGDTLKSGFTFPVSEATIFESALTETTLIRLSDTLKVIVGYNGTNCVAYAMSIASTGVVTLGSAVTINSGSTNSVSGCRMSATKFAVLYRDAAGSNYLCARVCTVSGVTITMGTELEVTSAAVSDLSTGVVQPREDVLAFAYVLTSDGKGYVVASLVSDTTIAAAGTPVVFNNAATKYPAITSHDVGDISVAYQNDGASNDPITIVCGTVSAAGVVAFGTAVSLAGTAGAATSISIGTFKVDMVGVGWIDNSIIHVVVVSISTTTPTAGTELEVGAVGSGSRLDVGDVNTMILTYIESTSSHGVVVKIVRSSTTLSVARSNHFTLAATSAIACSQSGDGEVTIVFSDTGDSSYGKVIQGKWKENLIDVRGAYVSEPFIAWTIPVLGGSRNG